MRQKKLSRALSLVLALLAVTCLISALGMGVFAASDKTTESTKNPVRVTGTTVTFDGVNVDYEYMICDEYGVTIPGVSEWVKPESVSVIFEGLSPNTKYVICSRNIETWEEGGSVSVRTQKTLRFIPLIIVLGVVLGGELVYLAYVMVHNSKVRKAFNKAAAVAPFIIFGSNVSGASVYALIFELMGIMIASAAIVHVKKLEASEDEEDNAEENEETVEETTETEQVEEAAEETVETEQAEEVVEEAEQPETVDNSDEEVEITETVVKEAVKEVVKEAIKEAMIEAVKEATMETAAEKTAEEEVADAEVDNANDDVPVVIPITDESEESVEETEETEPVEEVAEETEETEPVEEVAEETAETEQVEEAVEEIAETEQVEEAAEETAETEQVEEAVEEIAETEQVEEAVEEIAETEQVEEAVEETAETEQVEEVAEETAETEQVEEAVEETAETEQVEGAVEEIAETEQVEEVVEEIAEPEQVEEVVEETAETEQVEEAVEATTEIAKAEEAVIEIAETPDKPERKSIINDDPAYAKLAVDERGMPITPDGMLIRYKWSCLARLYRAQDDIKYRYLVLRRLLLSYKKVRSNISWNYDSYFLGRKQIAKIKVRGKALVIYLPFEYSEMENTKYRGKDVSKFARYKQVPFCYRVNGNRKLKYAMELIRRVLEDVAYVEPEYVPLAQVGEAIPEESFEELYLNGLIKIGSIVPANDRLDVDEDEDDDEDDTDVDDDNDTEDDGGIDEEISSHTVSGHVEREIFNFIPDKKRTTPVFEKVSVSEVGNLMTDEEAKAALYDLTVPQQPEPEVTVAEASAEGETAVDETANSTETIATPVVRTTNSGYSSRNARNANLRRGKTEVVNIDMLNSHFENDDFVNLKILKEKKLVPKNTTHVKILARGTLDKKLTVCANQFSIDAIKMITLVGGNAVKTLDD